MIGILGGTFDPVHFGHLRPALEIHQVLGLDQLRLVPCKSPPHRPQPQAPRELRLAMLQAAIRRHPEFSIYTREFDREGPSYMLDTLKSIREEMGAAGVCLLLGMDSFLSLPAWYHWRELINFCHIVVMTRPGSTLPGPGELADFISQYRVQEPGRLETRASGMLWFHPVTQLDISGTRIRGLLASGKDAGFLLPEAVLEIIEREGLYARDSDFA